MKKFFRLVSVLAIAGLTLTYTSCTDYSEDIDKTNGRIDDLENVKLPDLQKQIDANKQSIADLNTAIADANKVIEALKKQVGDLDEAHKADIKRLETLTTALTENVTALTNRVQALEDLKDTYLTKDDAAKTYATLSEVAQVKKDVSALQTDLAAANSAIEELGKKHGEDIEAVKKLIEKAQTAADNAQSRADAAFKEIGALKESLKEYVKQGAFEAQVKLLTDKDNELEQKITANENAFNEFKEAFDDNVKKLIKESCESADGKINKTIAEKIKVEVDKLETKISGLRTEVTTEFNKVWNILNGELRSLVFVPELIVDGVEAVEYTYAWIQPREYEKKAEKKFGEGNIYTLKNYEEFKGVANEGVFSYPADTIQYEMNPSSASVKDAPLTFLVKDIASITTKAPKASALNASYVDVKDGNLYVGLKATSVYNNLIKDVKDSVTLFALQATVRKGATDTTITSDYARLYSSLLSFEGVAFSKEAEPAFDETPYECEISGGTEAYHLFADPDEAVLAEKAQLETGYMQTLDLNGLFVSHYKLIGKTTKKANGVYEEDFKGNPYEIKYEYTLVDYTKSSEISESSFAAIADGKLTPKGGKTAIDREPLVRVDVKYGNNVILRGYVRVKITSNEFVTVEPGFEISAKFGCDDATSKVTAENMKLVYKALDFTSDKAEADFDARYVLQLDAPAVEAVRYIPNDATNPGNGYKADTKAIGTVTESAATLSELILTLTPEEQNEVYKMSGHKYTTYVRYIRNKAGAPADKYEGVYVPITVEVTKNAPATVGAKLAQYWFGANNDKAYLNVQVPGADPGRALPATWVTPINQVWDGNKPVFKIGDKEVTGEYRYYFAPIQTAKVTVDGEEYAFSVRSKTIYDKYDGSHFEVNSNDEITEYELKLAADYGHTSSIYYNTELLAGTEVIATIDQATGKITYKDTDFAKKVLNSVPSVPRPGAVEDDLRGVYAVIGVVLKSQGCAVAVPLTDQTNMYYFLRPINADFSKEGEVIDSKNAYDVTSNINVLDVVTFSDWRGEDFVTEGFKNLWFFKYYNISNIKVDVDPEHVYTNLNGSDIETTTLKEKTEKIQLFHCTGDLITPTVIDPAVGVIVDYRSDLLPNWGEAQYDGLVKKFGFIRYQNNGTLIDKPFELLIPVEVTYTWGTIKDYVKVTVNPKGL